MSSVGLILAGGYSDVNDQLTSVLSFHPKACRIPKLPEGNYQTTFAPCILLAARRHITLNLIGDNPTFLIVCGGSTPRHRPSSTDPVQYSEADN